jgi:hypothetical protein
MFGIRIGRLAPLEDRRAFWRFWGSLVLGVAAVLVASLAVAVGSLWLFYRPDYRGTLVVVSEAPIASADAVYEGRLIPPTVNGGGPPFVAVWEDLRPRYSSPDMTLRIRLEDGRSFILHQFMHHRPNWPCRLYTLHIDADGMRRANRTRGSRAIAQFCSGEGDWSGPRS